MEQYVGNLKLRPRAPIHLSLDSDILSASPLIFTEGKSAKFGLNLTFEVL